MVDNVIYCHYFCESTFEHLILDCKHELHHDIDQKDYCNGDLLAVVYPYSLNDT